MAAILLLRFEAPLMSFGGVRVDETNPTNTFPGQSMLTGLIANALGLRHEQADLLADLQEHMAYAARVDVEGKQIVDYQTVDLGQEFMRSGWTTWGHSEGRAGGTAARLGTHQRWRHYWADRVVTVSLSISSSSSFSLDEVQHALSFPARTLFLGRKPCIPSVPILQKKVDAKDLVEALQSFPLSERATKSRVLAQWPKSCGEKKSARLVYTSDERDWHNQIHVGRRKVYQGQIDVAPQQGVSR